MTGAATHIREKGEGDDESGGEAVDIIVNHGVTDNAELVLQYGHLGEAHGALIGAKLSVIPDRVAVLLPVGPMWGYDSNDAEYVGFALRPEVILGAPLSPNAEVTGGLRLFWLFPDEADSESFGGADVGVRLSTDLDAWAVHPTIGVVDPPGDGYLLSLGVGLSFTH